ncbi:MULTISPECIES: flavin reductase family protein [Rhizobium]|uniref:Flavin reductase family protein n=1 Tax=Rhizobium tropici TaxID=398 RepID=A0A329YB53_RHITR|nr:MULTISPECIES: flavin reductase family protein [Rhizobium]MBB3286280.1 flavin reductase (DIM6/NTAB) family NADH-FMN oxidoreductase RutF [Rhizobium sp. BK252]MBB3400558.1 flavin reductase (DIM6/NTAB) family NADH-FMN oxidoreductase RutF [Rhizobium sp. BK289]MBB3413598.1 flavin reductase (DIM6/NTAB) family NADH-FMN oxidoreductase RutF [Rhizobium sp. BK284]MBB3481024.1 flavin reductase (DIM6/NTAB) family NADH-FMN oxidoreductase RutF [Rhizobium sp. BK347]MDK4720399.1 flavin reductase family prote
MFYTTDTNRHGLAHDPFKAIVAPRPIGWIGSKGRDGSLNLSPYSFFNAVSDRPKLVMFSSAGRKDSVRNVEETGVFTANLVSRHIVEKMNHSSIAVPYGINEFELAGLTATPGKLVDAPYVGEAFAVLECRMTQVLQPKGLDGEVSENIMVIGQVVGIHIDEAIICDGRLDMALARPVARMGYMDYSEGSDVFEMMRPRTP